MKSFVLSNGNEAIKWGTTHNRCGTVMCCVGGAGQISEGKARPIDRKGLGLLRLFFYFLFTFDFIILFLKNSLFSFIPLYFCTFVLLYLRFRPQTFFAGMPGQVHQVRQVRAHEHGQALPALREEPWPRRPYPGCKSVQAPRRNEGGF